MALVFALATLAPAGAQGKPTIAEADANLTASGALTVWGRVIPPRPKWTVGIEVRTASAGEGWTRIPGISHLSSRGRFRMRTHLSAHHAVLRPVVLSTGRIVSSGQALAVSVPGKGDGGGSLTSPAPPAAATSTAGAATEPAPGSQLLPGQTLTAGMQLLSPDGVYRLIMQGDGNLVLYKGGTALWATGTDGNPGARAVMQGDGNFVVYVGGIAKWNSHTNGFNGAYLALQNDSNLVVYGSGHPLWDRNTGYLGNSLRNSWTLTPGAFLLSADRQYRLIMQGDGNLVLYKGGTALWATGTDGNPGARAVMQGDGNLVVYVGGIAKWNSHTNGFNGALLVLQDDSNLVIYQGSAIWDRSHGLLSAGVTEGQWPGTSGPVAAHDSYGYPYPNASQCTAGGACVTDAWLFYQGQCTSWVAYRLNQLNGFVFNNHYGGRQWGDASKWGNTASAEGIAVNGTPALGSVAWYPGHVAYVEKVISGTEVVIAEMNYDYANGFRVRRISTSGGWPSAFIHIHDR
ncbi:MAG TPA: CHAP domain-containing protein [Solirubrobacterales bacterium]|nr:CHAP domain-containing protein [Solirubrobacterales bacterium]